MTTDDARIPPEGASYRGLPEVTFHKECPVFAADRGAYWKSLRGMGRVVRIKDNSLAYYITHRGDILAMLRDPEKFAPWQFTGPYVSPVLGAFRNRLWAVPMACNPADHQRVAKMLHPLFAPHALAPHRDALRAQAAALVDRIAPRGSCEATVDIGDEYACRALLTVFGLPSDDEVVDRRSRPLSISTATWCTGAR